MERIIYCEYYQEDRVRLEKAPYPGETGKRIYESISKEAWQLWLEHQTMLINENRLSMLDPEARQFLNEELQKFFFGEGSTKPKEYIPPE